MIYWTNLQTESSSWVSCEIYKYIYFIIEEQNTKKDKHKEAEEPGYIFRMNYSKLYKLLFETTSSAYAGTALLHDEEEKTKMFKAIFKSIHDIISTKHEEVIQIVDVLEYFIKILESITCVSLLKYALKLLLEILKGDFIIKGERPFKSFY